MVSETDKAWLAGIVDGEGCITFHRNRSGSNKATPAFYVCNTNETLMLKVVSILKSEGIEYYYRVRTKSEESKKNRGWKDVYSLRVSKIDSLTKFLLLIRPYLISKCQQSDLVYQSLLATNKLNGLKDGSINEIRIPYANRVWELNKKGNKPLVHIPTLKEI